MCVDRSDVLESFMARASCVSLREHRFDLLFALSSLACRFPCPSDRRADVESPFPCPRRVRVVDWDRGLHADGACALAGNRH